MRYAKKGLQRIEATITGQRGFCPCCKSQVISKCGQVKVNHWAHFDKKNCDSWYAPMTKWHLDWQNKFPKDWQEKIIINKEGEKHIADIKTPSGVVVEFQHSYLSECDIIERSNFYSKKAERLIWVLDGEKYGEKFHIESTLKKIKGSAKYRYYISTQGLHSQKNKWVDTVEDLNDIFSSAISAHDNMTSLFNDDRIEFELRVNLGGKVVYKWETKNETLNYSKFYLTDDVDIYIDTRKGNMIDVRNSEQISVDSFVRKFNIQWVVQKNVFE